VAVVPTTSLLVDILKGVVGSAALFFAYLQLPVVGMAAGIFSGFPAIYFGLYRGRAVTFTIVALAALLFIPVAKGVSVSLFFLMQSGIMAAALVWFLCSGRSGTRSLMYAVALNLGALLLMAVALGVGQGSDPNALIVREIDQSVAQWLALSEKAGMKGEELQMLRDGMQQAKHLLKSVYPALVVGWVVLVAGMNLLLVSLVARRLPVTLNLERFNQFRNPDPLVWLLIAAGFALLLPASIDNRVALNALIVICICYFVQGLAVVAGLFDRFAVPGLLRNLLYLFMLLQPYLLVAVTVLGIFDIWGDFRAPREPKNL
jgi:hypothetical protein